MHAPFQTCTFCSQENIVLRNTQAFCRFEREPATRGHLLVIPFRHATDFTSLTADERAGVLIIIDVNACANWSAFEEELRAILVTMLVNA